MPRVKPAFAGVQENGCVWNNGEMAERFKAPVLVA